MVWLFRKANSKIELRSFLFTVLGIFILGTILDLGFGYHFFMFPNRDAVKGIYLPAFDWSTFTFVANYLPVEEFLFYLFGGIYMLSSYLWGVLYWFKRYNHNNHAEVTKQFPKLIKFSPKLLVLAVVLIVLGIIIKRNGSYPEGFPGYFTFLVVAAFIPIVFCYRIVSYLINWRAFTFMSFTLILVSIVYEATLGVPYGWWKYQSYYMLGIFVTAWMQLPIEAVLLWIAAGFGTVLLFEFLRAWFYSERSLGAVLFGERDYHPPTLTGSPSHKPMEAPYLSNEFGFPVPRGPYTNTVGHLTNYLIEGDLSKLEETCNKYLNFNPNSPVTYKPFSPFILATFAFLQGYVNKEDSIAIGQLPENDLVFWVPTIAWKSILGVDVPTHLAMFPYRLFVDSPYGLCSGREALGFFKNFAQFEGEPNPTNPYFGMKLLGFKKPDPNSVGGYYDFVQCLPNVEPSQEVSVNSSATVRDQILKQFKKNLNPNDSIQNKVIELLTDWLQPTVKCVSVKQFRDISRPDLACYQTRVEVDSEVTDFKAAHLFEGDIRLKFHPLYTETLVRDLGIKLQFPKEGNEEAGYAKSLVTFWADATFNMGTGKEVV